MHYLLSRSAVFLFVSVSICLGAVSSAHAEGSDAAEPVQNPQQILRTPDYRGSFSERSTITGDWGGARQDFANKGVTLDANLTQVFQGVASGGIDTGADYMGRGEVALNFDTAKMGLWPGGLLTIMWEGNFGNPLTKNTGALFGTNVNDLLPETENSFVLPQFTYTQFLSPKFGIVLGKFATINAQGGDMNEFAHGKGGQQFLNLAFSINPVSALTVPYSTLGASLVFLPNEDLTIVGGVLDPHGKPDSAGFDSLFDDGITFTLEGRYKTGFLGKTGHQLLGATYSTSEYTDLDQRVVNLIIPQLPTKQADNSWSIYWNMDQYFYQPDAAADKGVGMFARFGMSDGQANPIRNFASAGIGGKGMLPGREYDAFGLGYFYSWISDNRITSQLGFEDAQGVEAFYEVALTPAVHVTPDFQWIQPSQGKLDASWVAGMRIYTSF